MDLSEKCRELYLEGVTDAYVYPMEGNIIPIPFSVSQILSIDNCAFSTALLHVSTTGDESSIEASSITASTSVENGGNGQVFTFSVSMAISDGSNNNVREACKAMRDKDCYVVLRKSDDSFYLCYTLPGTFSIKPTVSVTQTSEDNSLAVSLKSMSAFIPIILKE